VLLERWFRADDTRWGAYDSNVLFAALYRSGAYLAEAGRIECLKCIAGLRQYGLCFEEAFDRADELELIYQGISNQLLLSGNPGSLGSLAGGPGQTTGTTPNSATTSTSRHGMMMVNKNHQPLAYPPFPPNLGQMSLSGTNVRSPRSPLRGCRGTVLLIYKETIFIGLYDIWRFIGRDEFFDGLT
jgi:hypothetical protein